MKKLLLLLLVILVAGYAYYRHYTTTPTYSLLQARSAVEQHDAAAFNQYVDVETITGSLLEEAGKQGGLLSLINPGSRLVKGLSAALKPFVAASARQQVETYIATGSVAEARKVGGAKV